MSSPPADSATEKELTTALRLLVRHGFTVEITLAGSEHLADREVYDPRTATTVRVHVNLGITQYTLTAREEASGRSLAPARVELHGTWQQTTPQQLAEHAVQIAAQIEHG